MRRLVARGNVDGLASIRLTTALDCFTAPSDCSNQHASRLFEASLRQHHSLPPAQRELAASSSPPDKYKGAAAAASLHFVFFALRARRLAIA